MRNVFGNHDESELEVGEIIDVTTPPKKRQPFDDLKIEGYKVKHGTHDGTRWTKLRKLWDEQEHGLRHRRGPGGIGHKGSSVPWASKPGSLSVRLVRLVNILFNVGLPSVSHLCLLIRWL